MLRSSEFAAAVGAALGRSRESTNHRARSFGSTAARQSCFFISPTQSLVRIVFSSPRCCGLIAGWASSSVIACATFIQKACPSRSPKPRIVLAMRIAPRGKAGERLSRSVERVRTLLAISVAVSLKALTQGAA
jgi:hypothetical protein